MDIPGTLVLITVLILVVAFVARPFVAPQGDEQRPRADLPTASALRRRADLLAGRNRVYGALRDLDFEHQTNKIADEEYATQRRALVAEGVAILQELDQLPAADKSPAADPDLAKATLSCPQCGTEARVGDAFCGHCGAKLATQE